MANVGPVMDVENLELKVVPDKGGYSEEDARLLLQGKPMTPQTEPVE